MKRSYFFVLWMLFIARSLYGQIPANMKIDARVVPQNVPRSGEAAFVLTIHVPSSFHISDASNGLLKVVPDTLDGIGFGSPVFPAGMRTKYGSIYRGTVEIRLLLTVDSKMLPGEKSLRVKVVYQPCDENDDTCYPPQTRTVETVFTVLDEETVIQPNTGISEGIAGKLVRALESGSILAFILIFTGGLLTSLTPCVYPMIPITIAVIGVQSAGNRFKGFILSLFYVLGVATTFSVLGVAAAKTGSLFGSYTQHPIIQIFIAAVFLVMGLSMLGFFILQMPSAISSKLQRKRGKGFLGAYLTGLVAGLVVSPCVGPLLIVILAWVAKTGSVFLGFGLLFTFALGIGVLFVVLGTFSGVLRNLPKSGGWTDYIEKGFGFLLIILAIFFLKPVLPSLIYQAVWGVFLIVTGTFLGAFSPQAEDARKSQKSVKALSYLSILIGSLIIFFSFYQHYQAKAGYSPGSIQTKSEGKYWISSETEGFRLAQIEQKPVLIDFFADWCAACRELDEKTWSDPSIQNELKRFVPIKLDFSKENESIKEIYQKYNVQGLPTVVLLNRSGEEMFRFTGFQPPDKVLKILKNF
jgi:thiol:disulfide interchange protein DsbD